MSIIGNNTFDLIGDSRTALQNEGGNGTSSFQQNSYNYFNQANALFGQRFQVVNSLGVPGDRTDQYLAAGLATCVASTAKYCAIFGVVNDFIQGYTAAQAWSGGSGYNNSPGISGACAQLIAAGKTPILFTEPGQDGMTATAILAISQFNQYARELAEKGQIILVDAAAVFVDPVASTSSVLHLKTGYTSDGLHPSQLGAYYAGQAFGQAMLPFVPALPQFPYCAAEDASIQTLPNNLFTTTTGGTISGAGTVTGAMPAGWSITVPAGASVTVSTVAPSPYGDGNDLELVITASAAADVVLNVNAAVPVAGDVYQAGAEFYVAQATGTFLGAEATMALVYNTSSVITAQDYNNGAVLATNGPPGPYTYTVKTPKITVPAGSAPVSLSLEFDLVFAASGSATIYIRRTWLRKRFS
jgi:hypothetical protein